MISGNFSAAPLDRAARWVTVLIVIMAFAFPLLPGMPIYGAILMPVVLFATWLFSVKGYTLMNENLTVHRPLWDTEIVLPPDAVFRREPEITKGLGKTTGNGGVFGYTGRFRNKGLGGFRAFATNWAYAVSITSESQGFKIVITPDDLETIGLV
jgi:hypothetical protein